MRCFNGISTKRHSSEFLNERDEYRRKVISELGLSSLIDNKDEDNNYQSLTGTLMGHEYNCNINYPAYIELKDPGYQNEKTMIDKYYDNYDKESNIDLMPLLYDDYIMY